MNYDFDWQGLCQSLTERFGPSIGQGSHRIVFHDVENNEVIKVPTRCSGISGNQHELDWQGPQRAKTKKDEELTKLLGDNLVIRMEYVEHVGWSEKPDWTWSIDCGQVGLTQDGRLVAYDWEHY